jgi:hypothetical protein
MSLISRNVSVGIEAPSIEISKTFFEEIVWDVRQIPQSKTIASKLQVSTKTNYASQVGDWATESKGFQNTRCTPPFLAVYGNVFTSPDKLCCAVIFCESYFPVSHDYSHAFCLDLPSRLRFRNIFRAACSPPSSTDLTQSRRSGDR